jgi:hypothetical protein
MYERECHHLGMGYAAHMVVNLRLAVRWATGRQTLGDVRHEVRVNGSGRRRAGLSAHVKYLVYVLRHKWFVLLAGLKTGAPLWRLLIHDWTKFLPREWGPYVAKYYGCGGDKVASDYDRAWVHHQSSNQHHWQHWSGDEMPELVVREMVADWASVERLNAGTWDVARWYAVNGPAMLLHPHTRAHVEHLVSTVTFQPPRRTTP